MITFGGCILTDAGGFWLLQPLPVLPPYTIRLRFKDGVTPTFSKGTGVQVSSRLNVWDLTYMNTNWFELLLNQTDLLEVIGGNTTGVKNMVSMFNGCSSLTTVALFDTSLLTSMDNMFRSCTSLTTVPLFNTSSVTNMNDMFRSCTSLTTVPLFNTSSVTSMNNMFRYCSNLTTVPHFDTSSVTDMREMFAVCTSLVSAPLFNTSNVTDMSAMFFNCVSLTSVPLLDTSSATNMNGMFQGCLVVQTGALALYQQASTQAVVPTHNNTFWMCGTDTESGAAELAQIPDEWK